MPFKKIVRKVKPVEVVPEPDPNQLEIPLEPVIPEDGPVKWLGGPLVNDDRIALGLLVAIYPFEPLKYTNKFGMILYNLQNPNKTNSRRIILLNQDLSLKLNEKGFCIKEEWGIHWLKLIGYVRGRLV